MDPLTILAIASSLGGLFSAFNQGDPTKQLRDLILQLSSPGMTLDRAKKLYEGFLGSPAYGAAQKSIIGGSNIAKSSLSSLLAARGLTGSGIGDVSTAVGGSLVGTNLGKLHAGAWDSALEQSVKLAQLGIGGIGGLGPGRNVGTDVFASLMDAIAKFKLLSQKTTATPPTQSPLSYGGGTLGGGLMDPFSVLRR
jgi:hypothetical protein